MPHNANLVVRSFRGGEELEVGKIVLYDERWIVHCWVYGKYQRHSQGAWGVRAPVLRFMVNNGIESIYFWDNKAQVTWLTALEEIRLYGTPGKPDQFGGTLNVPKDHWSQLGKLNVVWVPKEDRLILQALAEPWPMPKPAEPKVIEPRPSRRHKPEKPKPAGETLALPFGD